jgi:hypothetical protein
MIGWVLALAVQAGATESTATFEERLKRATGPAQLRELDGWCGKT